MATHNSDYPIYQGKTTHATSQGERELVANILAVRDPLDQMTPDERGAMVDELLTKYRTPDNTPVRHKDREEHNGASPAIHPSADWLTKAVAVASALWPECPENADSNVRDAYWLARCVEDQTRIVLPTMTVGVSRGVALVECVEKYYINLAAADKVVRDLDADTIGRRCTELLRALHRHILFVTDNDEHTKDAAWLAQDAATNLAGALHVWYGCISLGKVLRATARSPEDVPGEPPTFIPIQQNQRWKGYAFISTLAEEEAKRGNPWIRFGMTCTRLFERHRHNLTVDWWLPSDSPYWEG